MARLLPNDILQLINSVSVAIPPICVEAKASLQEIKHQLDKLYQIESHIEQFAWLLKDYQPEEED